MSVGLNRYTALITSEHNQRAKFIAMLGVVLQPSVDLQNLALGFPALFDLDAAVGQQLDVVGQWVGISRFVSTPISGVFFAFDTVGLGFDQAVWLGPGQAGSTLIILGDHQYRILLRAKIAINQWDGTIPGIYAVWSILFALEQFHILLQDNQDMSMTVILLTTAFLDAATLALLTGGYMVPRPAGVRITGYTQRTAPIFAFDNNNALLAGFDLGKWF